MSRKRTKTSFTRKANVFLIITLTLLWVFVCELGLCDYTHSVYLRMYLHTGYMCLHATYRYAYITTYLEQEPALGEGSCCPIQRHNSSIHRQPDVCVSFFVCVCESYSSHFQFKQRLKLSYEFNFHLRFTT